MKRTATATLLFLMVFSIAPAQADTKRIIVLGDSLVAGYGLQQGEDYPSRLQAAMVNDGYDVRIENAGVSGDTSAGGLARLDWSIYGEPQPSLVIIELGANDMLRGFNPKETKKNLGATLSKLKDKKIPAILFGMKAPTNLDTDYRKDFDSIYPDLAKEFSTPLYPFFLEKVATKPELNQQDGIHPTAQGIDIIVENTLPFIKKHFQK